MAMAHVSLLAMDAAAVPAWAVGRTELEMCTSVVGRAGGRGRARRLRLSAAAVLGTPAVT